MILEEILEYYPFPEERILLIPNGFQPQQQNSSPPSVWEDRQDIRRKYGFSENETIVLFTGTGWERKGLLFAIRAIAALPGRAKLLVAGRGPVEKYAHPQVIFAGPVSQMAPLYGAADIFLLPTVYDPFSNACLEALSVGLPVITTDANGFSEVLENEQLGTRCSVGDDQALVKALEYWLPHDVREKTRQARLNAAAQFSMEENIRKTLTAIRLVINNKIANQL
jgi:UDP-glucose:(heptosyl)LPS alpha-1,3-glucosyltransferase